VSLIDLIFLGACVVAFWVLVAIAVMTIT